METEILNILMVELCNSSEHFHQLLDQIKNESLILDLKRYSEIQNEDKEGALREENLKLTNDIDILYNAIDISIGNEIKFKNENEALLKLNKALLNENKIITEAYLSLLNDL
jgi:hypothetical protein